MQRLHIPLIILGSGPAGCTAAIYAARANINTAIISGMDPGGQLMRTHEVDNWPGDPSGLLGPELMQRMHEHVNLYNVMWKNDHIKSVNLNQKPFTLDGIHNYSCDALIIATGANAKYLNLPSEQLYLGKGVSACATCDGFFYKNKIVAVIGGGNTALEEAIYLSKIARQVILIHRRDNFRAEKMLQKKLFSLLGEKISIMFNTELQEIIGDNTVNGIIVKQHNNIIKLQLDGVFIAIGHTPNTTLFENQLDMSHGYLIVNNNMATQTSIPGVFAAGDVSDNIYRQAITSAGSGCMAALDAERYLSS